MSAVLRAAMGRSSKGWLHWVKPYRHIPAKAGTQDCSKVRTGFTHSQEWAEFLRPGDEVRRKPVADHVSGHLDGAVFRIAPRALTGETLLRARNVVINVDIGDVVEHHLAGRKLNELIACDDNLDLRVGPASGGIHIG